MNIPRMKFEGFIVDGIHVVTSPESSIAIGHFDVVKDASVVHLLGTNVKYGGRTFTV